MRKRKRAKKREKWRKDREDRRMQEQLYEKEYLSEANSPAGGKHQFIVSKFYVFSLFQC